MKDENALLLRSCLRSCVRGWLRSWLRSWLQARREIFDASQKPKRPRKLVQEHNGACEKRHVRCSLGS
jgi:hypothetical protein